MAARLAMLHWVIRLVRRERRQHALVIGLLTFGIASSVIAVSTLVRANTPIARELAGAEAVVTIQSIDASATATSTLSAAVAAIATAHPDIEVVARSPLGPERVTLIGQDPTRPLGQDWLKLVDGRWPGPSEITLSIRAVELLNAAGTSAEIGTATLFSGEARTVVGHYENPTDLDVASGIVPGAELGPWVHISALLPDSNHPAATALFELARTAAESNGPPALLVYQQDRNEGSAGTGAAMIGYVIGTVLCLQIAVLASAGFTVLANRRRRQLGLLAALGAEPGAIGSVMTLTGLVVGVIGGVFGIACGVAIATATTPLLQRAVDFRMSSTPLRWGYLLPMVPLAVLVAVAAAWWPARRVRRVSAIDAISDRSGRHTGFGRSLVLGLALLVTGAVTMKIGAPKNDALLIIGSVVAVIVGALLLAPTAAVLLGRLATNAALPVRVAWRDIARNRARSAAAIAAAAIAISLPFGVAMFTNSLSATWQPVVPTNVAMVSSSVQPTGALATTIVAAEDVSAIAAAVPGTRLVPFVSLVDSIETIVSIEGVGPSDGFAAFPYSVQVARSNGDIVGVRTAFATPELLDLMGVDPPPAGTDLMVWASGQVQVDPSLVVDQRAATMPDGFPEAILLTVPQGMSLDRTMVDSWYVVADQQFTQVERDRLTLAAPGDRGGHLSLSGSPPPFVAIRSIALALGGVFGLAAVAVAAALIRSENADDDRVLASVGARPRTARSISAATVGGLTLTAAIIAVVANFALLTGVFLNPDENFEFIVPWTELAAVLVAVPLVGAMAAWLLTSTRHDRLARRIV